MASSTMLAFGTALPEFKLPDVRTAGTVGSQGFVGSPLLVVFICVHCPYVKRIQHGFAPFAATTPVSDLPVAAIAANDFSDHAEDSPENQARVADELGYRFPVLYDETQDVARAFSAACTPDFFRSIAPTVLRIGASSTPPAQQRGPGDGSACGRPLIPSSAGNAGLELDQIPSMGCSIKWRSETSGLSIVGIALADAVT